MSSVTTEKKKIVILGCGFAGLFAARSFANSDYDVTIVDKENYHVFQPLLYQVATSELDPAQIAYPIRSTFRHVENVDFLMAEVTQIDFKNKYVFLDERILYYDAILIALGSVTNDFHTPGADTYCFRLKNLEQAMELRNHILSCFERVEHEPDPVKRKQLLTFTIIGGGPTGVELSGALSELINGPIRKDFPRLDLKEANIVLLQAMDCLLPPFPKRLQEYTQKRLQKKGVDVRLNAMVSEISEHCVSIKDGSMINSGTVIWTAGVKGAPIASQFGVEMGRGGRVLVNEYLQLEEYPEVFVAGDIGLERDPERGVPMVATAAIQQGEHAAKNIRHFFEGSHLEPFAYNNKGSLAVIGRNAAVADVKGSQFTGFLAWILWLTIHLAYLIGFRNRLMVLINWGIDYLLKEKGVRVILPKDMKHIFGWDGVDSSKPDRDTSNE
ncbi:NAD(P)/FAD-dependent oxidoreductase [Desulfovibrio inopinatus]|uniref:NAD(P)/FAD-dependent oxidoreductase n=1 Tax=Desulfovibrio inopinatus TaxID=102109 RepID=UPI0004136234|nr:NAD(P)/FAD-dependent oxidoreductase [Desulfovibrio inopinatus]